MVSINQYKVLIFDCDGVILNSNKTKTEAFRECTIHYGAEITNEFIKYHKEKGGISRQKKFEYFLKVLGPKYNISISETVDTLCNKFAKILKHRLLSCDLAPHLNELQNINPDSDWLVVSGGNQLELEKIFKERKINHYFKKGIYGNPRDKYQIISDLKKDKTKLSNVLFIGDSKYDYEVASFFKFDFI